MMTTDTLSPASTSASAVPPPSVAAVHPLREGRPDDNRAASSEVPSIPNPTTVIVTFPLSKKLPRLSPAPHRSRTPSENGYQFEHSQSDGKLIFEIAPEDRSTYSFSGCAFSPVLNGKNGEFPMPEGCSYRIHNPFKLIVDLAFTPDRVEQVHVRFEYQVKGKGAQWHDPQVGNDGGNIVVPRASGDDTGAV